MTTLIPMIRMSYCKAPKEYATLKNLAGKDWSNDIESVIVGSNATVRAYEDKDFKGTELAFVPDNEWPIWESWTWRTILNRSKFPAENSRTDDRVHSR